MQNVESQELIDLKPVEVNSAVVQNDLKTGTR